jgi:hypothetical protein
MISVNKLFSSRRVVAESAFAVSRRGKRSARAPGSAADNFIHIETCNAAEFANRRLKSDRIGQQDGPRAPSRHHLHLRTQRMSATALQRCGTQKLPRMKPGQEIFSQFVSGLTGPRGARFSSPADVIAFSALIHLIADRHRSSSLEPSKQITGAAAWLHRE